MEAVLACFPGEVEGVDGDAVPADAGSGVVGGEAEGFGGGCVDDLVDVDAHAFGDDLHLVREADVHGAVDVLEEFGHLRGAGAADGHELVDGVAVEGHTGVEAGAGVAADDLGDAAGAEVGVAWVLALG